MLRRFGFKLFGIVNGLDYDVYNPAKDSYIFVPYHAADAVVKKAQNKEKLQKFLGLPKSADTFLIGMVSRMSDQKGFDLIDAVLDRFLAVENVQLAVLGTGEERYQNMFRYYADKYPDKLSANIYYSEQTAHRIYAGADAFLMPSLFEPCGLSQLISLRYGTVPIVRETGGLKDTVEPYNKFTQEGTGFSFANYNAEEMFDTIRSAMQLYYTQKSNWQDLMRRGMDQDFSWRSSVEEYERLYESVCGFTG